MLNKMNMWNKPPIRYIASWKTGLARMARLSRGRMLILGILALPGCSGGGGGEVAPPPYLLLFSQHDETKDWWLTAYAGDAKYTVSRNIETEVRSAEIREGILASEQRELIDTLMSYQKRQTYNMDDDCSDEEPGPSSYYSVHSQVHDDTIWCFSSKEGVSATTQEMLEELEELEEELWEQGTRRECTDPDSCEYDPNDRGPKSPG